MNGKTGKETLPCGCKLDHDREVIDPCKDHVLDILYAIARDNDGRIDFAK